MSYGGLVPRGLIRDYVPLFIICVLLLIIICLLNPVSYFWDESWVYAPAVQLLAEQGPSLLPGSIPVEYSRGHPMFFHFIASCWVSVFGSSIGALKAFATSISIVTIIVFYKSISSVFSLRVAIWSSLVWISQSIFMAQMSMVLPEMLLSLFVIISIYAKVIDNRWLFITATSLLLMVKESGIVLIAACLLYDCLIFFYSEKKSFSKFINTLWPNKVSIFVLIIFLQLQYWEYGWHLYPEHLEMQDFKFSSIINKVFEFSRWLLLDQFRWILVLTILVSALLNYRNNRRIFLSDIQHRYFLLAGIFAVIYLAFCSINFFSSRYLLVLTPIYALAFSFVTSTILDSSILQKSVLVLSCMTLTFYTFFIGSNKLNDVSLGQLSYMKIQKQAVKYIEEQQLYDEPIYTNFLMQVALASPLTGYRNTKQAFTHLNIWDNRPASYYQIFTSIEPEKSREELRIQEPFELIHEWESASGWIALYKKKG